MAHPNLLRVTYQLTHCLACLCLGHHGDHRLPQAGLEVPTSSNQIPLTPGVLQLRTAHITSAIMASMPMQVPQQVPAACPQPVP